MNGMTKITDNDNGYSLWFLMEYLGDYTILYLKYLIYTDNTLVLIVLQVIVCKTEKMLSSKEMLNLTQ